VSPLWGKKKPIFGLLSKNNTGMAALRAGQPVKMDEQGIGCGGIIKKRQVPYA